MKKILILVIVAGIGAFLWWTVSPLFIDKVVEDELDPEIIALLEQTEPVSVAESTPEPDPTAIEPAAVTETPLDETVLPPVESPAESTVVAETSTPAPDAAPSTFVEGPFPIVDTPTHPATGNIRLIRAPEQTIVRYENYDGTNGPDLKIYLTNDLEEAADFVSLGAARGNQGNINYTVPADVDIDEYQYVVTWCEAFGVLFDYAEIN